MRIEAPRREPGGLRVADDPVCHTVWRGVQEAAVRRRGAHEPAGREGARAFRAGMQRGVFKYPDFVFSARGLGVLVVGARRLSRAGWPNGPPSPRLAPGGLYE